MTKSQRHSLSESERDVVYRAIGRFIVEFSYLQSTTELMVAHLLCPTRTSEHHRRAWAVISGQTAQPLADSFFSLLTEVKRNEWSDEDFRAVHAVRKQFDELISERNRIAHDVWSLGHPNRPIPEEGDAERVRFLRSPRDGAVVRGHPVTIGHLEALSAKAERVRSHIRDLGSLAMPGTTTTPSDRLAVE